MTVDHGPKCIACTDPAEARRQLAACRAELDAEAQRAAEHRTVGEAARRKALDYLLAHDIARHEQMQARAIDHLGTANAIAQNVMMHRAHLDRVEAAHPALTAAGGAA